MRGTNMAVIIGNVGNDPKVQYTQSGTCVAKMSVATAERYKNRDGEWKEETSWHNITVFGKAGEAVGEYVKKGRQVYVRGRIKYSKSTGTDGVDRYFTDIIAEDVQFLGSGDGQQSGDRQQRAPAQRREPASPQPPIDDVPFDDDIPF